jgi:4-hydroxy-2-oxoheptanedioate aldolase
MLDQTPIRKKISAGLPIIGTWNTLASPLLTEVMAKAGYDFQIIDLEHGPFVLGSVHEFVSACEGTSQCSPLVRIPANEEWMVLQAMDQGAHGVIVPHVQDQASAGKLARAIKYHPDGKRGFTPFSKGGAFNNRSTATYISTANREGVGVAIIESRAGLERVEEIVAQDGIDVVYFGAYDLSQDLGFPGDVRNPAVVSAIRKGLEIVSLKGKYAGGFVPQSPDDVKWLLDMGMRFITYDVDCSMVFRSVSAVTEWFAGETGQTG